MTGYTTGTCGTLTVEGQLSTAATISWGIDPGTTAASCVKYVQPGYQIVTLNNSTNAATFVPTPAYVEYVLNKVMLAQECKFYNDASALYLGATTGPTWTFQTNATNCYWQKVAYTQKILTAAGRLREILRSRHAPAIILSTPIKSPQDQREERARETLRMMLGEDKYRRFLARGFVAIRAKSGLVYRLFPGYRQVEVYKLGVLIEKLCIVLRGDFPPTDWLIMRYLLVLNDEADFRKRANLNRIGAHARVEPLARPIDNRPLAEIFAELRQQGPTPAMTVWKTTV